MPESVPTGDLMALALRQAGAGPIFTLNGAHIWGVYLGAEHHGIGLVDVRHEQTAGFAAEGWAKVTRRCGGAAATPRPGATHVMYPIPPPPPNGRPGPFPAGRAPAPRRRLRPPHGPGP